MTDLIFVDTNLVLYTLGKDARKKSIAREILATRPVLSAQVINEAVNVCLRRFIGRLRYSLFRRYAA